MCFCCVGWGLFLWNYWTTGSFQVCADRAAVEKNAKLLGAQGVAATLDFFVWTSLFELQGASLVPATSGDTAPGTVSRHLSEQNQCPGGTASKRAQ